MEARAARRAGCRLDGRRPVGRLRLHPRLLRLPWLPAAARPAGGAARRTEEGPPVLPRPRRAPLLSPVHAAGLRGRRGARPPVSRPLPPPRPPGPARRVRAGRGRQRPRRRAPRPACDPSLPDRAPRRQEPALRQRHGVGGRAGGRLRGLRPRHRAGGRRRLGDPRGPPSPRDRRPLRGSLRCSEPGSPPPGPVRRLPELVGLLRADADRSLRRPPARPCAGEQPERHRRPAARAPRARAAACLPLRGGPRRREHRRHARLRPRAPDRGRPRRDGDLSGPPLVAPLARAGPAYARGRRPVVCGRRPFAPPPRGRARQSAWTRRRLRSL